MNRLADATSLYLRQHADQPVDWYPWGDEAFARAREHKRPLIVSIGYSACHWCHVMAHESFDDPKIAALMNEHFVSVKVDREERPEIDARLQSVPAMLGQGGGWPLTVFLTPEGAPFFGGTYFPPEPRHGRPSFAQLLASIAETWTERPEEISAHAEAFARGFVELDEAFESASASADRGADARTRAAEGLRRVLSRHDEVHGGLTGAPKFPSAPLWRWVASLAADPELDAEARARADLALARTLEGMARGGLYDQLGGGFARYSTDREWRVPHFEKMLYDNAWLMRAYAERGARARVEGDAAQARACASVVRETANYLLEEMRAPDGRFFSASDADSPNADGVSEEGAHFVWTRAEFLDALAAIEGGSPRAEQIARYFGVSEAGNFEEGKNVLHRPVSLEAFATHEGIDAASFAAALAEARGRLLAHRSRRPAPARNEQHLLAWNAWTIEALLAASDFAVLEAAAGDASAEPDAHAWLAAATLALETTWARHVEFAAGGEDLRIWRVGVGELAHTPGLLEDFASLGLACLALHERSAEPRWRERAAAMATAIRDRFAREGGGFWMQAAAEGDDADGGPRTEAREDGPTPSGAALAVELLARFEGSELAPAGVAAHLAATADRFAHATREPFRFGGMLLALRWLEPAAAHVRLLVPAGSSSPLDGSASTDRDAWSPASLRAWLRELRAGATRRVSWEFESAPADGVGDGSAPSASLAVLVCRDQRCSLPLRSFEALRAELPASPAGGRPPAAG